MRPLDPRLLRTASAARRWVILAAVLQVASAAVLVSQAMMLAHAVAGVVGGAPATTVLTPAAWLIAAFAARAVLAGAAARYADRAAVSVIRQLRAAVLDRMDRNGSTGSRSAADLATLVTSGLDQLDGYLVRYLPQLLATALVTPMLLAVVYTQDVISAITMTVTLPLVPLFMALVGWTTQRLSDERITRMRRLGDQVLDLVAGLATLRALGRALPQAARVRAAGEAYRRSTSKVLQVAFLSGFVLELLTTISVALVAVGIGMRLVFGEMPLSTGLAVLILAPEVYLPLRMVGQHFHASTDGIAAAAATLAVLSEDDDRDPGTTGARPAPEVTAIEWRDVSVSHPGRATAAPAGLSGRAEAGHVTALCGANGSGKSTAVAALLGLRRPSEGRVVLVGAGDREELDVTETDPQTWWRQVAWVPQHPGWVPATLAENVELLVPGVTQEELAWVARPAGLTDVLAELPDGWHTHVGAGGAGLSAGQRQRLALARALLLLRRGARVLILDEPSAHLDADTERVVLRVIRDAATGGALVLVVAHRPSLLAVADTVLSVQAGDVVADPRPGSDRDELPVSGRGR